MNHQRDTSQEGHQEEATEEAQHLIGVKLKRVIPALAFFLYPFLNLFSPKFV
jgi:hypothetical protein